MTYWDIGIRAAEDHLEIFGAFVPSDTDLAPADCKTLVLFGPKEPGFWARFTADAEFNDGEPDPIDRWSKRVITKMAQDISGEALFPFGGPPYQPFIRWAMRSGRAWQSPAGPLVHDTCGMLVSYRGAIALPYELDLPQASERPCDTCVGKPCMSACPVGALSADTGYDLDACHGYLDTDAGAVCMGQGCAARRACPVSQNYGRVPDQSAFHMRSFHK